MTEKLHFIMPAELEKSSNGDWKIKGLASTEQKDVQGEIIMQKGIDLTPIEKGQGYFNFDHKSGPENLVGLIDGYKKDQTGLYVEGRLFQNHEKAKAIYQIMSSLSKSDKGRIGLSVEGRILERDSANPSIIKKCQIKNVAITFNPVNQGTYADLMKSLNSDSLEFASDGKSETSNQAKEDKIFSASEVIQLIQKALGGGEGVATTAPAQRSQGDALAQEDMDKKVKKIQDEQPKRKKMKKMSGALYKSNMTQILDKIGQLYPDCSRNQLWEAIKDRLHRKFPDLNEK